MPKQPVSVVQVRDHVAEHDVVGFLASKEDAECTDVVQDGTLDDGRVVHEERRELFLDGEVQVV